MTTINRRRTIRLQKSALLECKLGEIDKPAIKIAETSDEYFSSFRLLYDSYLASHYTADHPSRMLYSPWSLLPATANFVFKSHHTVISTMSHIADTELFGLPIDAVYKDEIDKLRARGRRVAEVGALATLPRRRWSNVMLFLARALFQFARIAGINDLVVMVNPKHVSFYTRILLFSPFGEQRDYSKVGAPAVALRMNLDTAENELFDAYARDSFETNLHNFFTNLSAAPDTGRTSPFSQDSRPLEPYSAHFLFSRRPNLWEELSEAQRAYFSDLYHFDSLRPSNAPPTNPDAFKLAVGPTLENIGLGQVDAYADTAFARNLGLVDYAGQRKLLKTRVAIPGMGGVGGVHLITLARAGFGAFTLADFDTYSPINLNRQYGSDIGTFGRPKLQVMMERALSINPFLNLRCMRDGLTKDNLDEFLDGVNLVVDGLDFFVQDVRRALFNRALELNIPVITAGPMGYSCALLVFMPGGMNYDTYFGVSDSTETLDHVVRFALGLAPSATHLTYMDKLFVNPRERRGPSMGSACQLCAGIAATEAVKIVLGKKPSVAVPRSMQFDAWKGKLSKSWLPWGMNSPWQRFKIWAGKKLFMPAVRQGAKPPKRPDVAPHGQAVPHDCLEYIVRAAIQAPSGDNVQPWNFRLHKDRIDLLPDHMADQSFFNPDQAATLLATGAALQNMVYAAGSMGIETTVRLCPEDDEFSAAHVLLCSRGLAFHEVMETVMWRRCTNRRLYSRKPVPPEVWARTADLAHQNEDALLLHCSDHQKLKLLSKAVFLADQVRVGRQDLHEHLMRYVHFTEPADPSRGMPLKNLQAGPAGELYLRMIRPWRNMRIASKLKLDLAMPVFGALGMLQCGGAGLICAQGLDTKSILQAGRALQRVWCALEHMGFAVQPMASLTLLRLRQQRGELSPEHSRLMDEAWQLVSQVFAVPVDAVPMLMFRTGRSKPILHGTYRVHAQDLILLDDTL